MVEFAGEILATSAVSAAILAALGYMLRSTLGEWFVGSVRQRYAVELEQHKSNLRAVADANLERLRADLQIEAERQNTRFSSQYEKVAEAIVGVHSRLDDAFEAIVSYTNIFERDGGPSKEERREAFNDSIMKLRQFQRLNRIYFPHSIDKRIKHLEDQMFEAANNFSLYVEHGDDQDTSAKEWIAVYRRLENEIIPLLRDLEKQFRSMLGIEDLVVSETETRGE